FDIDHNNKATSHHVRNFHAIGSGSVGAQVATALMSHYEPKGRSVRDLRLMAFRAVSTCIKVVDLGIGGAIQLWSAEGDGMFERADAPAMAVLSDAMQQWETIERES